MELKYTGWGVIMNIFSNLSIQVLVFISVFFLCVLSGPIFIPLLRRLKFGQTVRDDGPSTHLKKAGTPTIGGIIFLVPILLVTIFFYINGMYTKMLPLVFVTLGFGAIGFIDDFIKVVKKRKDGLYPGQKMFGLLLIATLFAFYTASTDMGTDIVIPFMGMDMTFDLAWAFVPFTILVLISVTNAVNLTDGVDGLASGVTLIVMVFFTLVAMTRGEWDYIKVFSSMVAGGCLGFMVFNIHPAKVFMGDAGALALGGAVGSTAILMKIPLLILIVGGVYVIEALSVIIQVACFKLTGKRFFKMAPIHHHFELSGWRETKVVAVFWSVTLALCIIGLTALRFRII